MPAVDVGALDQRWEEGGEAWADPRRRRAWEDSALLGLSLQAEARLPGREPGGFACQVQNLHLAGPLSRFGGVCP